jgi:hypothetical protein
MIYRRDGERVLMDHEALVIDNGYRPVSTIRAKCSPIACDVVTHVLLYDADDSAMILAKIARRKAHTRRRQRHPATDAPSDAA